MDGCVVIPPAVVCLCVVCATVVAGCDVGGDVVDTWVVCAVAGAIAVGVVCCVVDCVVAATVGEDKSETTIITIMSVAVIRAKKNQQWQNLYIMQSNTVLLNEI